MTRRILKDIFAPTLPEQTVDQNIRGETTEVRVPSPAIRTLGLQMGQIAEDASQASELREQLARGEAVVEIEPSLVDASIVADRLDPTSDADFRQLVSSMRDSGQQVPILVRPHPTSRGRYQVAYGHRRLSAAAKLQVRVKAVVRHLTDEELVVAQGKENLERRNLAFIERAVFAFNLENHGFDRKTIAAALGVGAPEASRLITVANSLPSDVIEAIGPAPKAGRPRWLELAKMIAAPGAAEAARLCLTQLSARRRPPGSDARFEAVLQALHAGAEGGEQQETEKLFSDADGRPVLRIRTGAKSAQLWFEGLHANELRSHILEKLPGLVRSFANQSRASKTS